MSEPDAVPLPREGEVFFDVRGEARSMRLSWYADSKVAVFSIWQGNRCTGTFRLPFVDLARMVQTLQSGPPVPAPPMPPQHDGYRADPTIQAYGQDRRYDYAASQGSPAFSPAPAQPDFAAASYQSDQGYNTGPDYDAGRFGDYGTGAPYQGGDPYGRGEPYQAAEQYRPTEHYRPAEQYRPTEQYRPAEQYQPVDQYQPGDHYQPVDQYQPGDHYQPTQQYNEGQYNEGQYNEGEPYQPARHQRTVPAPPPPGADWPLPASPTQPKRGSDADSVPDTAMMSFPSVPARNGPSGYR